MRGLTHRSLKNLLFIHEIAFLVLVAVTGLLSGIGSYFWQKTSSESLRINSLIYLTEQIRGELYRQTHEVVRARLLEDPNALDVYAEYSRRIDTHFNQLRQTAISHDEDLAIQNLQTTYREIQRDMNNIFRDPYAVNFVVRMKMLNPRFAENMVNHFEDSYAHLKKLLTAKHDRLELTMERWTTYAPVLIPVCFLMAVMLVVLVRRIVRREFVEPIAAVREGAVTISRGQLDMRIEENGVDEVRELAHSINQMARDLAASRDRLVQSEKQAALGALIPVVAHNIRNPLASIRATAQVLDGASDRAEMDEGRRAIIETIDRLGRWVNALVSYLHPLQPNIREVGAGYMVDAAVDMLKSRIADKHLNIEFLHRDVDRVLQADPDLMEQALAGLLTNAVEASPEGGSVQIAFDCDVDAFHIRIRDSGAGMPFEPVPGNLEPGPSTKRFGTGLGIPIAFKICQSHGWDLKFNIREGQGTEVVISAPLSAETESA